MKRILLFLLSLAAASVLSLQAGNYKNFKSVAYVTVKVTLPPHPFRAFKVCN